MKKLDPVVIIVDVLLLVGCGCMFLYGKMSAHTLFIVGIVCIVLYFVLRKKSVFIKYAEGYKHVLSIVLKYFLIVYGSISLVFSIILAILNFC